MDGWDNGIIPENEIMEYLQPSLDDFSKATCLVLPSGGVKGVYLLGAIEYLYENCGINHIESYYGTSIGSIISGLLIIGFTPLEILVYICVHKIVDTLLSSFSLSKILIEKKSVLDSSVFICVLSEMIKTKIGYIPTLGQLYSLFGKRLCIVTISRDNPTTPLYISSHSHPELSMVHALHMSSSIPFVFGYATYENIEYFDGGVLDQFPILYASKKEESIFGIDILCAFDKSEELWVDIINVISLPIHFINETLKKQLTHGTYIEIQSEGELVTKNTKDIITMFESGYRQCKNKLLKKKIKQD